MPEVGAPRYPRLERLFRAIVASRRAIAAVYAVLLPAAVLLALRVPSDSSIDRLIVSSDADYIDTRAFQRIFPEGKHVILLAEAVDPFSPAVLAAVRTLEMRLGKIARVESFSALSLYRRAQPEFAPGVDDSNPASRGALDAFRRFATGSDMLHRQGLVGADFWGIPLALRVESASERDETLEAIDLAIEDTSGPSSPITIRRIGGPYVDAYLERETSRASLKYFPLFGLFIVLLNVSLYRSFRTLVAFLATLATTVALTVGFAAIAGFSFTIVSSLVPLTVLVTTTATLVYIHSRFVDLPENSRTVDDHQVFALANKFTACTASIFAAAVGFAALAVSRIRPVREMGLWVAAGMVITWIVVFTLFPALQRILRTPTQRHRRLAARWFPDLMDGLPRFSYRWRWLLVPASLVLCAAGTVALLGLPGHIQPMRLETDALDYIDHDLAIYKDTRRLERAIGGLNVIEIWVRTPDGAVLDPEVLRGLDRFSRAVEADPRVGSVVGPTSVLRWSQYVSGQGGGGVDPLPDDPAAWAELAGQLEQLLLTETTLRSIVDVGSLAQTHFTVISDVDGFEGVADLRDTIQRHWRGISADHPALASCSMKVVGEGLLQAKIAHYLVPTLAQSFFLTAAIIFVSFLAVFRSGAARLMAMIPSVFAILVVFLLMRLTGIPLNVATILIASTVLGASENDQIHFFYHFQEKRVGATTEQALRHTLLVAGRAILFATLINAGGFLALALSPLPPMRQFGIVSSAAFLLSMLADFTVLPASLWIVFRQRPDAVGVKGS